MSKRQKGRRHRRVNRTPRPAGRARPVAPQPAVRPPAAAPQPAATPDLGRHAARTWQSLRERGASGASLDELAAAAGYQARTVLKHVTGLAGHGLAELRDDRWYARETAGAPTG
ncbi:hypothetical protein GO002_22665 [Streptomyces eurocidicus]|uniref:HTH iclR-type domain-containing protein n=1 Tax=Streptomyces eurocidicus TaxID=66423 RepID=A0A7W8B8L9_STREU|nr:hypothetical protein [Streptomyces eurocidicus]MBB5118272.1 hypothetical protein [Streptomyces eurocidicus]MBF6054647.1 hypothetical protein [Streptomyces eurocidicus]